MPYTCYWSDGDWCGMIHPTWNSAAGCLTAYAERCARMKRPAWRRIYYTPTASVTLLRAYLDLPGAVL